MANASVVASSNATCSGYIDQRLFDLGCLGPALAIILILAFLKRRESFLLDHCNGYPGLVIAISFLGNFKNRFTIAATFGATASTCLILLLNPQASFFPTGGPSWLKFIQGIVSVIVYGILFYPLFACVTTNYKLVGSLMGFLYAAIRFSFQLVLYFQCGNLYNAEVKHLRYREVLSVLPVLLCLLFITIRFAVLLCVEVKHHWSTDSMRGDCRASDTIDKCFAGKLEMEHINRLLNSGRNRPAVTEVKWYLRLLYCMYQPRPDFKFSTQFISTLVVAGMALFQVTVILLIRTDWLRRLYRQVCSGYQTRMLCEIQFLLIGSLEGSVIACSAISAILLLHFMKCHRDHIIQMYRGDNTFCHDVSVSPRKLVGRSLRFSGYQIAYTLVGYFILILPLWLVCSILGFLFKYAERLPPEILDALTEAFLPTIATAIFLWLFQYFLAFFVFCDRDFPNITITVDNRQLFSIMSYFFFFYNILLGFFSSFLRILKGILLGVLFLPRIDRTCLMRGFQTWDSALVAYLGFVNVLVAHSHPVMLAFCQLLIDRNKDLGLEGSLPQVHSLRRSASREEDTSGERAALLVDARPVLTCNVVNRQPRIARFSQRAVNRWLVAVMLLRNPSLIKYRKQGVARPFLTLRSVNSEDSALV